MKFNQVKYITAASPEELETAVNVCLRQDNRWLVHQALNVFDKPDVQEDRVWVQTLIRYVDEEDLELDNRRDI